jgi:hypothetical protein
MVASPTEDAQIRVRVWFGQNVIADYRACRELAEPYARAMSRRFAGLRVTSEVVPLAPVRGGQR